MTEGFHPAVVRLKAWAEHQAEQIGINRRRSKGSLGETLLVELKIGGQADPLPGIKRGIDEQPGRRILAIVRGGAASCGVKMQLIPPSPELELIVVLSNGIIATQPEY